MQRLTRVGVLSAAKLAAITSALMALVVCIPYALLVLLVGGAAGMGDGDNPLAAIGGGVVGAVAILVLGPLIYLVLGFVVGAIYAFFVNLALRIVGGLELELS